METIIDGLYKHPKFGTGHVRQILKSGKVVFDRDINGEKENVNPNDLTLLFDPNARKREQQAKFETMKLEFPIGQIVSCGNVTGKVIVQFDERECLVEWTKGCDFVGRKDRIGYDRLTKK